MNLRIPTIVDTILFHLFEFRIKDKDKNLYLTFDDGPIPEVTPQVLNMLERYNAKATFFCVGDNVRKHREVFLDILKRGHRVGNHTFHHLGGMTHTNKHYYNDIIQAKEVIDSNLFRPPYGRLWIHQVNKLRQQGFRFILWSKISFDYRRNMSKEQCWDNVSKLKSGDIILFHDSIKARKNMFYALEKLLEYYSKKGFSFKAIK
ncbi:MAG: polysaccharide deacetylase family protein [Bacteroidales bacterium]|jgi:peptidoglycan/xylan/chitin deacetylase (PgdA/CDA1 family)|nr:polysaccharide deacetylase family protein [Bacteroidales bacterium]